MILYQEVVQVLVAGLHPKNYRDGTLRICVDDEHLPALIGEVPRQRGRCSRLRVTATLVCDHESQH
jgi:hypothetical protein